MGLDRLFFSLFYRIGFTPWDGHKLPARLTELIDSGVLTPSKAIDLGCGTGDASIYLAKHGWEVTGVDFVERALVRARAKSDAAGARIRFERVDVTRLDQFGVGSGFTLLLDSGCLHGMSDAARDAYVPQLRFAATAGARLILAAFPPNLRGKPPRGIDRGDVEARLAPDWELLGVFADAASSNEAGRALNVYDFRRKA